MVNTVLALKVRGASPLSFGSRVNWSDRARTNSSPPPPNGAFEDSSLRVVAGGLNGSIKAGLEPPVVAALVAAAVATAAKASNSVLFRFRRLGGSATPLPSAPSPSSCSFRHHSPFFFLAPPPLAVQWV